MEFKQKNEYLQVFPYDINALTYSPSLRHNSSRPSQFISYLMDHNNTADFEKVTSNHTKSIISSKYYSLKDFHLVNLNLCAWKTVILKCKTLECPLL